MLARGLHKKYVRKQSDFERRVRSGLLSKGPSPPPAPRNVICAKADLAVTARCAANVASHRNCLGFSRFATSALAPDGAELARQ